MFLVNAVHFKNYSKYYYIQPNLYIPFYVVW